MSFRLVITIEASLIVALEATHLLCHNRLEQCIEMTTATAQRCNKAVLPRGTIKCSWQTFTICF